MSEVEKCTYCGKPIRDKYGFSYGIHGIPRVYKCDRRICTLTVRIKRKANPPLRKFLRAMYALVSDPSQFAFRPGKVVSL